MYSASPRQRRVFLIGRVNAIFSSGITEILVHKYLNLYAIIKPMGIPIMVVGGELTVQNKAEIFGMVLKSAREKAGITVETLAERVGVTDRYIYRLENNGKTPGYAVLCRLIRELAISPDLLFYPEKSTQDSEVEALLRQLATSDERAVKVAKATIRALIDTAPEEQA